MRTKQVLMQARKKGWPDRELARLAGCSEETIRRARVDEGREMAFASVFPIYQKVVIGGVMWGHQ